MICFKRLVMGWLTELAMIVLFRIYFFMNKIANWLSYSEFSVNLAILLWLTDLKLKKCNSFWHNMLCQIFSINWAILLVCLE